MPKIDFEELKNRVDKEGFWEDMIPSELHPMGNLYNKPFCDYFTEESREHLEQLNEFLIDGGWLEGENYVGSIKALFDGQEDDDWEQWIPELQKNHIIPMGSHNCLDYPEGTWDELRKLERKVHYKKDYENFITIAYNDGGNRICSVGAVYDKDKEYVFEKHNVKQPMNRTNIKRSIMDADKGKWHYFGRPKNFEDLVVIIPENNTSAEEDKEAYKLC